MNDLQAAENETFIQSKGKTAPRLTPEFIASLIVGEQYYNFPGTTVMVCCLALQNGHNVVGSAASVSMENFDAEIGKKISRQNAVREIWSKAGYLLSQQLYEQKEYPNERHAETLDKHNTTKT